MNFVKEIKEINDLFAESDKNSRKAGELFTALLEKIDEIEDEDEKGRVLEEVTDSVNYYDHGTVEGTEFWFHSHC